mmetsp:Transcript_25578/g.55246  ORF Transcript_25578/g.55246 Transcript_25578/m.55246 type:complete len:235 (+) Transcript_25578:413-1117(+)
MRREVEGERGRQEDVVGRRHGRADTDPAGGERRSCRVDRGSEKDERVSRKRQRAIATTATRKRRVFQRLLLLHRPRRQCRTPPAPRWRHFRLRRRAPSASIQGHGAGHVDEQRRVVSRSGDQRRHGAATGDLQRLPGQRRSARQSLRGRFGTVVQSLDVRRRHRHTVEQRGGRYRRSEGVEPLRKGRAARTARRAARERVDVGPRRRRHRERDTGCRGEVVGDGVAAEEAAAGW